MKQHYTPSPSDRTMSAKAARWSVVLFTIAVWALVVWVAVKV